jgi:hypothetical protein
MVFEKDIKDLIFGKFIAILTNKDRVKLNFGYMLVVIKSLDILIKA